MGRAAFRGYLGVNQKVVLPGDGLAFCPGNRVKFTSVISVQKSVARRPPDSSVRKRVLSARVARTDTGHWAFERSMPRFHLQLSSCCALQGPAVGFAMTELSLPRRNGGDNSSDAQTNA